MELDLSLMAPLDQIIDHAAELQQQLDRIWAELLVCYLTLLALAVLVALLAWRAGP
jgi:hypothetical protein